MRLHSPRVLTGLFAAAILLIAIPAFGQQPAAPSGIGVVTALQGQATVARQALPAAAALHFRDDVFFRDQIATRERSTVRLLLGGKGVVTVREQSQVTLDETVAADGARRSILNVLAGKIAATIAHALMRPGDEVEIRTPDAVAAIRGTVLIAEYIPPKQSAETAKPVLLASSAPGPFLAQAGGGSGGQSNFFVLTGNVVITPLGQPPVTLGPLQSMSVTATAGGVQPGTVQNITPSQLTQVIQGLDAGRPLTGEVGGVAAAQGLMASLLAEALVNATGGGGTPITSPSPTSADDCNPCLPPPPPPAVNSTENTLPSGPLLSLSNMTFLASGTPIADFTGGPANAIVPISLSGPPVSTPGLGNLGGATSPILLASGNLITHSGMLISLNNSSVSGFDLANTTLIESLISFALSGTDPTSLLSSITSPVAPAVRIAGTTLTNTGGALLSTTGSSGPVSLESLINRLQSANLSGISGLFTFGSFLSLEGGSLTASGPGLDVTGSAVVLGGPVFALRGGSHVTWSGGGPLIRLNGSTLIAGGGFGDSGGTGNAATISGAPGDTAVMLDAVDSTIIFGGNRTHNSGSDSENADTFSAPAGVPLIHLAGNSLYIDTDPDGELISHSGGTSTFDGYFLDASNSEILIAGKVLDVCCGEHLTTTTTGALIKLVQTPVSVDPALSGIVSGNFSGNFVQICCGNSTPPARSSLTVNGLILDATNSDLTVAGSLLMMANGSQLTSNATDGLFQLSGGTHRVGSVLQMDSGLLNASGPIVNLIKGSNLDNNGGTGSMQQFRDSVTGLGPAIGLNNSTLQVSNGALVRLIDGSSMTVNGDFATLMNGSKIHVQNGPMISVEGQGSSLTVNGALINFIGTGNQVIVNNPTPPPGNSPSTVSGIPVSQPTLGSISIAPNSIKNPSGNITTFTGAGGVIQTTGGGTVRIGLLP